MLSALFIRGGNAGAFLILFLITDILLAVYFMSYKEKTKCVVLAVFSALGLSVDMRYADVPERLEDIAGFFYNSRFLTILLMCLFYFFYLHARRATEEIRTIRRSRWITRILSAMFSIFILFGLSYQEKDSWDLVFGHMFQMCKSYTAFIGVFLVIYYVVSWVYAILDSFYQGKQPDIKFWKPVSFYLGVLRKYPFSTAFITMLIFNLPYMILSYPAIVMGDTADHILQAFQIPSSSSEYMKPILMSESQLINQHHSVAYTMLIHILLCFGKDVLHSANMGVFFVAILQTIVTFASVAYLVKTIVDEGASDLHLLILLGFFIISPRLQNYLFLLTKDVLYGAVMLFSMVLLWKIITHRQIWGGMTLPAYFITLIAMLLLRNEAVYITIIQMMIYLFMLPKNRKAWGGSIIFILAVHMLFAKIIYPMNNITPTTINEMLSIPIQQTARYVINYPGDVTPEEREAIDRAWEYDEISEEYWAIRSDTEKERFRLDSSKEDLMAYLKVWAKMFFKHPDAYIQATMNNYYEYVYPGANLAVAAYYMGEETDSFEEINEICEKHGVTGMNMHRPHWSDGIRERFESLRELIFSLSFLSPILSVACYTWVFLVAMAYWIYHKNKKAVAVFIPLLLVLLVCFAGPCNGSYFRYFYPMTICLPAAMSLSWSRSKPLPETRESKIPG